MPSSTQQVHQHQLTLPLLIRFLTALSAHKLPTQAQLSDILLATLKSPIFDADLEHQPHLIQSVARLLAIIRKFTDLNNNQNQFQRLIYALLTKDPQTRLPPTPDLSTVFSSSSPTSLLKMLLLASLEIPRDTIQIIDNAIILLIDFFQDQTLEADRVVRTSQQAIDRLVAGLVKFLVNLHHNIGSSLKDQVKSIYKALSDDFESFQLNNDFWDIINLFGECISGFFGTRTYWDSLAIPCHELAILFSKNKEGLLKPLQKLQVVIVLLFDHFDEQLYSPKLYDNLRLILEELKASSRLIAKPAVEITRILEAMHRRAMEEDQTWRELLEIFEQVSTDLIHSVNLNSLPRQAAGSLAKSAFDTMIEYLVPRLLFLMNEIPSPRIEFVSPTMDAVIDPASFTSTSGFLPGSIFSTTVLRFEIKNKSSQNVNRATSTGQPNPFNQLTVKTTTKQRISICGLRVMSKNVGFYFHKKVNPEKNFLSKSFDFTNFEDEGQVDLFLGMGNEDGLSLDFELEWNHFEHHSFSQSSDQNYTSNHNGEKPNGLFTIENFKVDLKGFGIFPHDSSHPILNWFLKPGLEPYLHAKLIRVLEEYLLNQISKLNDLLGKMRARWEESLDSGLGSWERFFEVMKLLNSNPDEPDETDQPATNSKIDGLGLTFKAEDNSYAIRIGHGQKMLPGKGVGGPGKFQERLGMMRDEVGAAIDSRVMEIASEIAQARIDADRPGWESDLFNLHS